MTKEERREYEKKWRMDNKEKNKETKRKWCEKNPEKMKEYKNKYLEKHHDEIMEQTIKRKKERIAEHMKFVNNLKVERGKPFKVDLDFSPKTEEQREKWHEDYEKYKEKKIANIIAWQKVRRKKSAHYRTICKASVNLSNALKVGLPATAFFKAVGYTKKEIIVWLVSTIPERHTWIDFIEGRLVIDHHIPKRFYDFESYDNEDFKRCYSLKNMRLVTVEVNRLKGRRFYTEIIDKYDLYDVLPKRFIWNKGEVK